MVGAGEDCPHKLSCTTGQGTSELGVNIGILIGAGVALALGFIWVVMNRSNKSN